MKQDENLTYYKHLQGIKKVTRFKMEKPLQEPTASHVFLTIALANDIIDHYNLNLNKARVIELLIYHDFAEIGMEYDFPAAQTSRSSEQKKIKKELETNNILNMSKKFSRPEIKANFDCFENPKTDEEIFANLIDKIETSVHIADEKCAGFVIPEDFEFILHYTDKYNKFPQLENLIESIKFELNKCYEEFKIKNNIK